VEFFVVFLSNVITVLSIVILVDILLSYFMDPFHPVRHTLDQIVEPMLRPIRRIVPPLGGLDFSPIIFILLLQLIARLLTNLLL
jgi:YggT family protein